MKKLVIVASAFTLLSAAALPTFAVEKMEKKTPETMCKEMAEKDHVTADKMDAYIKTCVEKHMKKHGEAHPAMPAAPAAPAK